MPSAPARFALQSADQQVQVTDRRATSLLPRIRQGGDLVMHADLPLGPGTPYRLSYLADEAELARLLRNAGVAYAWKLGLTLALGLALVGFARHWAREQHRVTRIHHSMGTLTEASGDVADIGRSLARDSHRLNDGAAKQAASLQETSAALPELSSLAQANADRMTHSRAAADRARMLATTGRTSLGKMIETSARAQQATEQTARVIHVIDEIAFQTNVLALNAAVEAARAGAAGMGFAVVAEEVRSLAMRCAESARDTQELLDKARALATENTRSAESAAATLTGVVDATHLIAQSFEELTVASAEQAKGVTELTRAIEEIESVTVVTAQLAHSVSGASDTLTGRADELEGVVQELGDLAQGHDSSVAHQTPGTFARAA
jgi:ABC-type transporter Mla subunit MlaD